ncbi:MAG: hypothetical protein QXS27_07715 [Candidatus Jordarchaeaceae archaeon]
MPEDDLKLLLIQLAKGLGFEVDARENRIIDARKLRYLNEPKTVKEMRQRTTLKVTRYTLHQIRARCPPAMTTDAFLQQLLFLYDAVKNKGVVLDIQQKASEPSLG